jgi:hypothetical protein
MISYPIGRLGWVVVVMLVGWEFLYQTKNITLKNTINTIQ